MKKRINKKEDEHRDRPVDQANLDIAFVKAFVDLLFQVSGDHQTDDLEKSTVCSLAYECTFKINRLKKFIDGVPLDTMRFDTEGNIYIPKKP
jgi:hypothetical protein